MCCHDLYYDPETDFKRLNRREDEFETKRDWDDFLEQREEIIMNLIMRTDVAATEKQLAEYAAANESSIRSNATLEREESDTFQMQQAEEEISARARRDATRQAYEDERRDKRDQKTRLLDQMATGQYDANAVSVERAKGTARKAPGGGLTIKGIKERPRHPIKEKAYDPFMGMVLGRDYYTLQKDFPSAKYAKAKNDTRVLTGGYDFEAFYDESMLEAFAGLACFIEDEVQARDAATSKEAATAVAAST